MVDKLVSTTFENCFELEAFLNIPDKYMPEKTNRDFVKFVAFDTNTVYYYITDYWDVL